jgi:hypothetical protein
MRAYDLKTRELRDCSVQEKPAEPEAVTITDENPFAKAAYEWNNALMIAARKMWEVGS